MKILQPLKDAITRYFNLKIQHLKLEVLERLVTVTGYLVFIALLLLLMLGVLLFLGFGLAEYFSALFDSRAGGYFATAGVMLLLSVITFFLSKKIVGFFANKVLWLLTKKNEDNDKEH